jgi:hypothetical protein
MHASPPWRDIAGTLSCFVKITISVNINPLFENQVWARGMVKKDISMLIHQLISKS